MIKRHRSSFFVLAASIALALPVGAVAQSSQPAMSTSMSSTPTSARQIVTIKATVIKVDQKTRDIQVRGPKGNEVTVTAGPEVKNLAQLNAGDQVTLKYMRAAALKILPAGSAALGEEEQGGVASAAMGEKPGGLAGGSVSITAKITAIDMKHHTVTLAGADGNPHVVEVKNPELQTRMAKLKVGELVRITYTEALAVMVNAKD